LGSPSFFCMPLAAASSHFFRPPSLGGSLSSLPFLATFLSSFLGPAPLASPCFLSSRLFPPSLPALALPPSFSPPPLHSAHCSPCLTFCFLSGSCGGLGGGLVEPERSALWRWSSFSRACLAASRASPSCVWR